MIGQKIKVFLSSQPRLLSDVIRRLVESQPDMEVVGEVVNPMEFLRLAVSHVDVLIITPLETNGHPNICTRLLSSYPALRIVTLSGCGEVACLHQSNTPKSIIQSRSEQSILDAVIEAIRVGVR